MVLLLAVYSNSNLARSPHFFTCALCLIEQKRPICIPLHVFNLAISDFIPMITLETKVSDVRRRRFTQICFCPMKNTYLHSVCRFVLHRCNAERKLYAKICRLSLLAQLVSLRKGCIFKSSKASTETAQVLTQMSSCNK